MSMPQKQEKTWWVMAQCQPYKHGSSDGGRRQERVPELLVPDASLGRPRDGPRVDFMAVFEDWAWRAAVGLVPGIYKVW